MERIVILDFGSQYTQLIARRLRELSVYSEILPYNTELPLDDPELKAIILSGSPFSVNDSNFLDVDLRVLAAAKPILGVCYGAQLTAKSLGGKVAKSDHREYGKASLCKMKDDPIFNDMARDTQVWMSHADSIVELPAEFETLAETESIPVAAFRSKKGAFNNEIYCVQFHPEVTHSLEGLKILDNYVTQVAGCSKTWTSESFIDATVKEIKSKIGDDNVILGLSGGVDSTVAGTLIHKAIGNQLTGIFIDNGLLRKNEYEEVLEQYKGLGINVIGIPAKKEFLSQLEGISDPELKRKTIGRVFIEVFERESKKIDNAKWLAQGTIYPDVIESVSVKGPSATIKSHHNVGGLPDVLDLKLLEPLRTLFKDEVRSVGKTLGLSHMFLGRHPFPGPGMAIRVLGELTEEKIRLNQEADNIYISKLKEAGWYDKIWQAGTILLPVKSVGVMGDERTYEFTVALRAVNSKDGMTAEWTNIPHELLGDISNSIINQVRGINRVVYDISTKPPATIEWE